MSATLNVMDGSVRIKAEYCDTADCPAKALYVIIYKKRELSFCGHHFREHEGNLIGHVIAFGHD